LPNVCAASGDLLAVCRGSSVEVLDWSAGAPRRIHHSVHTSAIEQACVVGTAVFILDFDGSVWKTGGGHGLSPVFAEPGFRQIAPWGRGVAALTAGGEVVVAGGGGPALPPVAQLLPAPPGHAAAALRGGLVTVLREGTELAAARVTWPRCVVSAAGRLFAVAYGGTLTALDGGAGAEAGEPVLAACGAGDEVVCSTLSGLIRCRPVAGGPPPSGPAGRPARAFTGDSRVWAVYDDEVAQLYPAVKQAPRLTFDTPQAAVPVPSGLAVAGRRGGYLCRAGDGRPAAALPPGSDIVCRGDGVVLGSRGAVSAFGFDGDAAGSVRVGRGQSCVLRYNRWDGTLGVALDWSVHVLDGALRPLRAWQAGFTPLCAVWAAGRAWVASGEDGLYAAGDAGLARLAGLGLEAALDVCAVSPTEIAVATGAAVVKVDCAGEPRAVARLPAPGVRSIDCADGTLAVLAGGSLLRAEAGPFRPRGATALRNDGKLVRAGHGRIAICGYDSVEVETAS
jgi:hypothetical protein